MRLLKSFLIGFLLSTTFFVNGQGLLIEGSSRFIENGTVLYIEHQVPQNTISGDSGKVYKTVVDDQKFKFLIETTAAELYRIYFKKRNGKEISAPFFLEPGKWNLNVKDSFLNNIEIKGSKAFLDYIDFCESISSIKEDSTFDKFVREAASKKLLNDPSSRVQLDSLYNERAKGWAESAFRWIKTNNNSPINSYVMYKYLFGKHDEAELKLLYKTLKKAALQNCWGRELAYCLDHLAIGTNAPLFSQKDTSGNEVSLSDFRGKYVLIDFWASWCGPCRKGNPLLVNLYSKYNHRGFVIISVSLDEEKEAWENAIIKDKMLWVNISDLKGRGNSVAKLYQINPIPMNFLLDREGKIMAKDLHGEDLANKLVQIFNE